MLAILGDNAEEVFTIRFYREFVIIAGAGLVAKRLNEEHES